MHACRERWLAGGAAELPVSAPASTYPRDVRVLQRNGLERERPRGHKEEAAFLAGVEHRAVPNDRDGLVVVKGMVGA